jgi:hypothetical protein
MAPQESPSPHARIRRRGSSLLLQCGLKFELIGMQPPTGQHKRAARCLHYAQVTSWSFRVPTEPLTTTDNHRKCLSNGGSRPAFPAAL